MTATDELRRMLDERGVKHFDGTENTLWGYEDYNEFTGIYRFSAYETSDGRIQVRLWHATPAQAIAATLGVTDATAERRGDAGTCRDEGDPGDFCCSECGVRMFTDTSDTYTMIASDGRTIIEHPNFCPNCGRRVEQ